MILRPRCYYPILKRHSKAPYLKGITKKDTHATPSNFEQIHTDNLLDFEKCR